MRIAQVAPLWERVPPPAYGGIELIVSLLTEELVRRGHEVTLFASGDSITTAKLSSVHPREGTKCDRIRRNLRQSLRILLRVYLILTMERR